MKEPNCKMYAFLDEIILIQQKRYNSHWYANFKVDVHIIPILCLRYYIENK